MGNNEEADKMRPVGTKNIQQTYAKFTRNVTKFPERVMILLCIEFTKKTQRIGTMLQRIN